MQVDISADQRRDGGQSRFPKLKLQLNERARIVVVSRAEKMYVHAFRAPNIVNMAPTYTQIKNKEGQEVWVVEKRWLGSPICFGSPDVLKERGTDEHSCEACEMASERPDIFQPPAAKFAVNILKYGLRPGGHWNDIAQPYGVSALIWVFGDRVLGKLVDIRSKGPGYDDLRMVDLLLYCDDPTYQKPYSNGEFDSVAPAVWLSNDGTRNYTAQYLAANGASTEDLNLSLGKRVKKEWVHDDIVKVIQRWDVVRAYEARQNGSPSMGPQGFGAETLQQGMQNLQQQYGGQGGTQGYANSQQPQGFVPSGPQGYASNVTPPGQSQQVGAGLDLSLLGGQSQQVGAGLDLSLLGGQFQPSTSSGQQAGLSPEAVTAALNASRNGQNPVAAAYEAQTGQWQPPGQEGAMFQPPSEWQPPAPPFTGATQTALAPPAVPTASAPAAPTSASVPPTALAAGPGAATVPSSMQAPATVPSSPFPPSATAMAPGAAPGTSAVPATAANPFQPAPMGAPPAPSATGAGALSMPTGASPSSPPQGLDGLKEFMAATTSNPSMTAQPSVPHEQLVPPSMPDPAAAGTTGASATPVPAASSPSGGRQSYTFEDLARLGQQQGAT